VETRISRAKPATVGKIGMETLASEFLMRDPLKRWKSTEALGVLIQKRLLTKQGKLKESWKKVWERAKSECRAIDSQTAAHLLVRTAAVEEWANG
jgi:hypothetical protein